MLEIHCQPYPAKPSNLRPLSPKKEKIGGFLCLAFKTRQIQRFSRRFSLRKRLESSDQSRLNHHHFQVLQLIKNTNFHAIPLYQVFQCTRLATDVNFCERASMLSYSGWLGNRLKTRQLIQHRPTDNLRLHRNNIASIGRALH